MKSISKTLLLGLAVVGIAVGAYAADFEKGLEAFHWKDYETALLEWRPLAEQGDAEAQFFLGRMYANGDGVAQDNKELLKWIRLAAEQEYARAQYFLGAAYQTASYGVAKDDTEAVKWIRLAAEQGYAPAQLAMGIMYRDGKGVTKDDKEAEKWIRLAAEQGDAEAQLEMWKIYRDGTAVSQDKVKALMWAIVAESNAFWLDEKKKENWMKQLTAAEITQAEQLAEECEEKEYKGC